MRTKTSSFNSFIVLYCLMAFVFVVGIACSFAGGGGTPILIPTGNPGDAPTMPPMPTSVRMPEFPWPPPKPSATAIINFNSLTELSKQKLTFGDVDAKINEALLAGDYTEKSYFGIPGGFALVTQIEKINSNGSPVSSNRWAAEITSVSLSEFSLQNYLNALFSAPKGRYRIFVFLITSNVVVSSNTPVSQGDAQAWVVEGANKLPKEMRSLSYTKDYSCVVYIYEFIQSGYNQQAVQNTPSSINGKEHLQQAGLWDTLEK